MGQSIPLSSESSQSSIHSNWNINEGSKSSAEGLQVAFRDRANSLPYPGAFGGNEVAHRNWAGGPSPNNRKLDLYKTELCRSWEEKGYCHYEHRCQFAHGHHELRPVLRHPRYKTEICRTFWRTGSCPYAKRCW
ncbi:hypothetical protein IE53DRAFT_313736 [Violaceomyces palustris]|uniref:Uncharacterized protein n=1 Tax=Violaceomyces palustris TaxID=1673888 RepID=A0ACD0P0E7_9BASI|nr:hypothetical protein IE53DRAFT_313736 [Violaceomyces palustris]